MNTTSHRTHDDRPARAETDKLRVKLAQEFGNGPMIETVIRKRRTRKVNGATVRDYVTESFSHGADIACHLCEAPLSTRKDDAYGLHYLTLDRIIPGSDGGRYVPENLLPACPTCNKTRGDSLLTEAHVERYRREHGHSGRWLADGRCA
jgi:5-methylcytosine-specific restriction endonuclease McrA